MRSDDLAPLIGRRPPAGVGFRQGTVLAWDPQTADNTIEVGGSTFSNLTTLNAAEVAVIQPGDKVSILTLGEGAKTWFVVGRMTIPGGAEASIVRSADYVPATSGYTVNRDGSAEFQDLTARGDLTVNSLLAGTPGGARVELTPANFIKVYDSSNQLVVSITDQQMFLFGLNNSFARLLPDNGNFNSPRLELKPQPDPGFSTVVNAGGLVQASGLAGVPRLFLTSPIIDGVSNTATINVYSGYSGNPDTLIFFQADLVQVGTDLTVTGKGPRQPVIKPSNENVTANTTLQNDDHLFAPLLLNTSHYVSGHLFVNAGTTPDIKLGWTWPAGATGKIWMGNLTGVLSNQGFITSSGGSLAFAGSGADAIVVFWGYVANAGNAGNLQFQFAQNVSDATATTVQAGSTLLVVPTA